VCECLPGGPLARGCRCRGSSLMHVVKQDAIEGVHPPGRVSPVPGGKGDGGVPRDGAQAGWVTLGMMGCC
jgi:hypothetical protein